MPYFIAYKPTHQTSNIYVEPFRDLEMAHKKYAHLTNTKSLDEIIIPPFFASTEEEAREKARKLSPTP